MRIVNVYTGFLRLRVQKEAYSQNVKLTYVSRFRSYKRQGTEYCRYCRYISVHFPTLGHRTLFAFCDVTQISGRGRDAEGRREDVTLTFQHFNVSGPIKFNNFVRFMRGIILVSSSLLFCTDK